MRRTLLWAPVFFLASVAAALQDASPLLSKADALIAEHKYKTAFKALGASLEDVEIVLKKYEIVMNYYVNNIHYAAFSLKDIGADESITDYRGQAGSFEMVIFEVDKVLPALIKAHPDEGRLYKALGEYYHAVYTNYGELEGKPQDLLLKEMEKNARTAKELGAADAGTHFIIGLARLSHKDYAQGEAFLEECIRLDPAHADGQYNLAFALMHQDRPREALPYVLEAFELYGDGTLKADAAIMAGQLYWELQDTPNSVKYYGLAEDLEGDYRILRTVLQGLVRNGAMEAADKTAEKLLVLQPTNPTLPQQIIQIYAGSQRTEELLGFFEKMRQRFDGDNEAAGNVLFHRAIVCYQAGQTEKAREALEDAKARFQKCLPGDHQVFKAIEELLKSLKDGEPGRSREWLRRPAMKLAA